ncbi:EspA/EspE family type VII secretion system effector [Mycobacterium sp. NPDC006124]|uniref:EspA/EspE family type VII secretion system effector n=1 Tax=Mycobacterium sp. NPDC006124 TaxID=3156729 RepID=UPI0033A7DBD3
MGLIDAFDATWSAALATFGDGTPRDGRDFEDSSRRLGEMGDEVSAARPGAAWVGSGADAYSARNAAHHGVIGGLSRLDQRLAAEITHSAAVVTKGRRDLDAVRASVHAVAATLPPTVRGDQLLMPTVRRGLDDIGQVIQRSHDDARVIARRIEGLGEEYRALGGDGRPSPAPDTEALWGDDETVPGTPQRPFEGVLSDEEWRIARLSPTLLDEYQQARAQGWTFTSNPGVGTYTNDRDKVVNIDPDLAANGPFQRVNALSHELGHALKNPPLDRSSKDAFVDSRLDGEGAAVVNTIAIEREILAAGGTDIVPAAPNDDRFERIYDSYVQAGSTPAAYADAIRQIGQVYGTLVPSTDPSTTYREYYGRDYP